MTPDAPTYFSQSYAEARGKFLAAAEAANLDVHSEPHPLLGRDGEPLALDIVRDGPADARAVLILSSACHGVEGYCGSGVQVALLGDAGFRAAAHAAGVAVLYLHALNPYGFSWWRRTTHENVDLNRNFQNFHQPLPVNQAYAEIAHLVVPQDWPPAPGVQQAVDAYIARHGLKAWQTAVTSGQYQYPEGLFFGGHGPTWSQMAVRHALREHGQRCTRLGWIDFHTGLGPSGVGERIFACRDDAVALARARAWWGPGITSIYDGSSTSALLTGLMWTVAYEACPQAEYTGIALEYGTVPVEEVLDALRADQWLENHPEADTLDPARRAAIKQRLRDAFYTDTDVWKRQIVAQGREAAHQAVAGLGGA
ncbi:M14 family metallopeptidase [Ideonella sp. DXS22W]|uniref:M14 family metallopeptidase n=1 Tax=Pseudaquabacterium inlustre TaxID=2984192 RepID=A0ABU9CRQ7_9BURK